MIPADAFAGSRRTVTCLIRAATGERDAYGNPIWADSEVEVPGCLVAPTGSNENQDDADRITDSVSVYDLTGSWPDDSTVNRVRLDDDSTWEIDGIPQRWPGPVGGVVVQLKRVQG